MAPQLGAEILGAGAIYFQVPLDLVHPSPAYSYDVRCFPRLHGIFREELSNTEGLLGIFEALSQLCWYRDGSVSEVVRLSCLISSDPLMQLLHQ